MLRAFILLSALTCAGSVGAQSKWVDKDGRVTYGDAPPQGVNAQPMRRAPAPQSYAGDASADTADKADKKDEAAKKPLTAAEQDAAFRKRQQDAEKEREKQAKADSAVAAKRENCARAQDSVRVLEAGRVARTNAQGERYYLDDNQLAQEAARARQDVRDWCN
jgi:hypothetical protein